MNRSIGFLILMALLSVPSAIAQQKKPGTVNIGSVATDDVCDVLYVQTGPLKTLLNVVTEAASKTVASRAKTTYADEAKALLKEKARTDTWLPVAFEVFLGEQTLTGSFMTDEEIASDSQVRRVQEIFERIVRALPADQEYRFRVVFTSDPAANIKANPGGTIVVDSGMVGKDDILVAAVIAHEIAHVTKRHRTRQIQGYLADTLSIAELTQTLTRTRGRGNAGAMIETWMNSAQFLDVVFAAFHTDQELEADACVPRLLKGAGFDAEAGVRAFRDWALREHADTVAAAEAAPEKPAAAAPSAARRKSEALLAQHRKAARTASEPGRRALDRNRSVADQEMFAQKHPVGPDRVRILTASLAHWSVRDTGLRPADASASDTGTKAEAAPKKGFLETIGGGLRGLRDRFQTAKPADPAEPAATAAEPAEAAPAEAE